MSKYTDILTLRETLQIEGHENIFAIGDVADLPIQRSMYANMYQTRVGIHNMLNYLKGYSLTGQYKLESKIPMFSGVQKMIWYKSKDGNDSFSGTGSLVEGLNFNLYKTLFLNKEKKFYQGKASPVSIIEAKLSNKFAPGESVRPAVYQADH